jgi:hypothetical protein
MRCASDGGAYFGWFNKTSIENTVETQPQIAPVANFLAVNIEGPSRIGHYFRPVFAAGDAQRRDSQDGPIIFPNGQSHDFTIVYDPSANNGNGRIVVTLDDASKTFNLTPSDRAKSSLFDHFGLFGISPDGHYVEMYLDDLNFTVGKLLGDFNGDNVLTAADIDQLGDWINTPAGTPGRARFDITSDSQINAADLEFHVESLLGTSFGDADLDGDVDLVDLSELAAHYGATQRGWADGDFDGDSDVDLVDLSQLAANYGGGQALAFADFETLTGINVPEPASGAGGVALVAFAIAAGNRRRRKRRAP